jgi:hypothetical protein
MRWTNHEVRRLLRLMRRPHALERERLAVLLREAAQARDARTAVERVIERAFDPSLPADRLRLEIIHRCDIGGETTRAAARALHLSVRQFFRHRADAVEAIAQSIETSLRHPPDSQTQLLSLAQAIETIDPKAALDIYLRAPLAKNGQIAYNIVRTSVWAGVDVSQEQVDACEGPWRLLALAAMARHLVARGDDGGSTAMRAALRAELEGRKGARYDAVTFELAFLDRLDARRRADIAESRALLTQMRSLSSRDEVLLALTLISEAEQAMLEGDLTAAALALGDAELMEVHKRDLTVMARAALGRGMLSHVRGFHQEAYALANGAGPALAGLEAGFALRAAAIAGRAALFCGVQWSRPTRLCEKYPDVWVRADAEGVWARHVLNGDPIASKDAAEFALALGSRHASPVLEAYAKASLAAALDAAGEDERAQALRIAAWETALAHDDRMALYDLFFVPAAPVHDIGPMRLDKAFVAAVQRHLEARFPAYASTCEGGLRESSEALLRHCLGGVVGSPAPQAKRSTHARALARGLLETQRDQAQTQRFIDVAGRMLGHAVGYCTAPQERQDFEKRFSAAWQALSDEIGSLMNVAVARAG